jgi:predicted RNase H-like HicB family nuclease
MHDRVTWVGVTVRPSVQVVLEGDDDGWSAYVPSVPGCYAAARTREEVTKLIEEALTLHLQDLHETELREIEREASEVEAAERRA